MHYWQALRPQQWVKNAFVWAGFLFARDWHDAVLAYNGGEARSSWRVIPGSGTEDLAGLAGSGVSVAAAGQPGGTYSLDYELG